MKGKSTNRAGKISIGKILTYIFAFFWAFMTIFPVVITFLSSFKNNVEINTGMFSLPKVWRFSNYIDAWKLAHIGRAVGNSLFLSFATTVLVTVIGISASYILARKNFSVVKKIYTLFLVGVMVPIHCTIIPVSALAGNIQAKNEYWFLVLVYTAFNLAQAIFLYTGFIQGIDKEMDEAAFMDGCGEIHLLYKIIFPLCKPIIFTEAIFVFTFCYGELVYSLTLLSEESKYTMARAVLSFTGNHTVEYGPIFASIIVAVFPMLLLYILFHEKIQAGMMAGAVKG